MENGEAALAALKKDVVEPGSTVELVQLDVSSDDSIFNASEKVQASQGRVNV